MGVIQTQFCFHWVVVFCVEALNYILNTNLRQYGKITFTWRPAFQHSNY